MISEQLSCEIEESVDLVSSLDETARFLWGEWPAKMQFSSLRPDGNGFKIWGECPHCSPVLSVFETVTNTFSTEIGQWPMLVAVARCVACHKLILAAITTATDGHWKYAFHYPLGKPNDAIDENIPKNIAADFSEALRCQWVKAYNGTAEMCRRAVEASCINLGAPYSKVLQEMIDYLYSKGKITEGLKDVAHKVRLGGDRGAHPPEDPTQPPKYESMIVIEEDHADAIVNFTRHFLDHVYVIPKQLPTYDFAKPKKLPTT